MKTREIKIEHFMLAVLFTYIPFHLFEEALGNFPRWMAQHHWTPHTITYSHWMACNIFFYLPILAIGLLIYYLSQKKLLFAGMGVIIWGILNFIEHFVYSIIDSKVSPGLLTGMIYLVIAVLSIIKLKKTEKLSFRLLLPSTLAAIVYAGLPVVLQVICAPYFRGIFV